MSTSRLTCSKRVSPHLNPTKTPKTAKKAISNLFLAFYYSTIPAGMSKLQYSFSRAWDFWWNAHSIYFPVHLVLFFLRLRRNKKLWRKNVWKTFTGWLKSCSFAMLYAMALPFAPTYVYGEHNHGTTFQGWIYCFFFSSFILLESSSRWGEMSIYVLANWFESMLVSLKKRKLIPFYIPYFAVREKFIFPF